MKSEFWQGFEKLAYAQSLDVPTFKGGLGPEHFKASPSYQRLTPKEVLQYARAKPGRFAGGLALGAAGVGAAGYGIKRMLARRQEKQAEVLTDFEDRLRPDELDPGLEKTVSKAGPKLADYTEESDRSKFRVWKG